VDERNLSRRKLLSWSEFRRDILTSLYEEGIFSFDRYLFRGVSDAGFQLVTSFDRQFPRLSGGEREGTAVRLIEYFFEGAERYALLGGGVLKEVQRTALAQHYGVPTRLLDWTLSPYIAAYFAFRNVRRRERASSPRQVAVWCLNRDREDVWSESTGVRVIANVDKGSARERNQLGAFTISKTPFASLEEYVSHFDELGEAALIQYVLPAGEARVALAELASMGIRSVTLFPDLEGAVRDALERVYSELG
jgi:FRG domain